MKRIISVGAGVQSSYLALTEEADYYIFADTQDEQEGTYNFINNWLIPEMKKQNKTLTTVTAGSMYNSYLENNGIPTRQYRSCTDKFKIRPIRKYLRSQGINKAEMLLGITTDEIQREKPSNVKWITNKYPLLEKGISRDFIIEWWWDTYGIEPIKSGCYYCPFSTPRQFIEYTKDKLPLRDKIITLENNARLYNERLVLWNRPLEEILGRKDESLDQWFDDSCDSGYCFT